MGSLNQTARREEETSGRTLFSAGKILETGQTGGKYIYRVTDEADSWEVTLSAEDMLRCSCPAWNHLAWCRHSEAVRLYTEQNGLMELLRRKKATAAAPKLMTAVAEMLPEDSTLRLEVTLQTSVVTNGQQPRLRMGLRAGEERLYVVKSIPQFLKAVEQHQPLEFGKGFSYQPEWMHPGPDELRILEVLQLLGQAREEGDNQIKTAEQRILPLPDRFAELLLQALKETGSSLRVVSDEENLAIKQIQPIRIPLHFRISESMRGLTIAAGYPRDLEPLTASCSFVLCGQRLIAVEEEQRQMIRLLWAEGMQGKAFFDYPTRDAGRVIGEVVPFLKLCGSVEIDGNLERRLKKLPLISKVFLDREGKEVVARTQFVYGNTVIDPFREQPEEIQTMTRTANLLLRDAQAERRLLDMLGSSGFRVRKERVYLTDPEAIFQFVYDGVGKLQKLSEVYFSQDFRRLAPRKPQMAAHMSLNGSHLEIRFTENDLPLQEIMGILEALARRKRYFRLKDGAYLDLSDMDEWQQAAESIYEASVQDGFNPNDMERDVITLSAFRTAYLTSLLEGMHLPVTADPEVKDAVRRITDPDAGDIPAPKDIQLRSYQAYGFRWLMTLDKLHMGGILADDMGLGKTVQMISVLKMTREPGVPSLVVAPTSLTYNWLSELERFAPELSIMVMGGSTAQRASQLDHIRRAKDIDVLITSYPLIRRDIELMKDIEFRFVILDEAQHIKNAGSVGAAAVKRLKAQTRFALTGTPMENGTGELWSIFDFVLPGYLQSYGNFLRKYQDGTDLDDLRRRIRPFLLRRLKKDVLTELPDKLETTMTAHMSAEQDKVYQAAMLRLKPRVDTIMREKGLGRGRTEVLAAITELRQICCHPSLVLGDYTAGSGKLEMLLEFLPDAIRAGRRILLFSQFTSMLKILMRQLENSGYDCLYLDGETPASRRVEMSASFNEGKGQIFLISLKAGGTGLNLVGADMVIHYDPWWNPAAEDQATDRAHRIGQTHKVEVIRLVTHNSIEEQVVELGRRKKALFDQLITPGEEMVTALSEADIRSLFA